MPNVRLFSQKTSSQSADNNPGISMKTPKAYVTLQTVEPVSTGDGREEVLVFTFPFAPTDISIEGLAHEYAELGRPGRLPLVRYARPKPLTININVLVTHESRRGIASAEDNLMLLSDLAKRKRDLIVTGLGPLLSRTRYRITDMSATVNRLSPKNRITMASVSMTLTQVAMVSSIVPGMIKIKDVPIITLAAGSTKADDGDDTTLWPDLDLKAGYTPVNEEDPSNRR